MTRSIQMLLFAAGVAVATHFAAVYAMPRLAMHKAMATIGRDGARLHQWIHTRRTSPQARTIVRPSPDLAYSVCVFDLSRGDVRLRVHPSPGYWSLSLYAADSDNVGVWNDETEPQGVDVVLTRERTPDAGGGSAFAFPTARGIAVVRRLAQTDAAWATVAAAREHDLCTLLP